MKNGLNPKMKDKPTSLAGTPKEKVSVQVDGVYHQCGKKGHWRHNCKEYLEKKHSPNGMYFIDNNMSFKIYFLGIGYLMTMTSLK